MKSLNDDDKEMFHALEAKAATVKREFDSIMRRIADARRTFFQNPSDVARRQVEEAEEDGAIARDRLGVIVEEMSALLELTDEEREAIDAAEKTSDAPSRYRREELTAEQVSSDGQVEVVLERSFGRLLELIPESTLREFSKLESGTPWIKETDGLLSIVKGVVPESESPRIHRFAQSIIESHALLTNAPGYDMFAGASLIPQIARLADRLEMLLEIPGAMSRIQSLWRGPSGEVDSTMFELLVAAGCGANGRSIEFLAPQGGKTPDLRCHDPYPLVIECKRKRTLTNYEIHEESVMRKLFDMLDSGARKAGLWGTFSLHLSVEPQEAPVNEIVECLLQMRSTGSGSESVAYPWGTAAYMESDRLVKIGTHTRMYSPVMLKAIFSWNSDLADWDGLVCRVRNYEELVVDVAEEPVGLLWINDSERAIQKRSWGPMSTLNEAIKQIPPGEFGIPYIAYQEGARSEIADMRTFNFADWIKEYAHSANIRVPLIRLIRLYPRPLEHGAPDFIESSISITAEYADDVLPEMFPSNVIVH